MDWAEFWIVRSVDGGLLVLKGLQSKTCVMFEEHSLVQNRSLITVPPTVVGKSSVSRGMMKGTPFFVVAPDDAR